jgi:hypothetical protein
MVDPSTGIVAEATASGMYNEGLNGVRCTCCDPPGLAFRRWENLVAEVERIARWTQAGKGCPALGRQHRGGV